MARFSKILKTIMPKNPEQEQAEAYRQAIREEAKVGGHVFGAVPDGVRREFFCLDERTWVWHEEWKDETSKPHVRTTRYDVRPHGIFKAQNGRDYQPISRQEARNLVLAAKKYNDLIDDELEPILGYRLAA
jgi:hypothetical protein